MRSDLVEGVCVVCQGSGSVTVNVASSPEDWELQDEPCSACQAKGYLKASDLGRIAATRRIERENARQRRQVGIEAAVKAFNSVRLK